MNRFGFVKAAASALLVPAAPRIWAMGETAVSRGRTVQLVIMDDFAQYRTPQALYISAGLNEILAELVHGNFQVHQLPLHGRDIREVLGLQRVVL